MTNTSLADFVQSEKKRIENQKEQFKEERDLPGLYNMPEGETRFSLDPDVPPREHTFNSDANPKIIFRIVVEGKPFDWALNPKNPAYDDFINRLDAGEKEFRLLRTGQKMKTRYKFLEVKP